MMINFTQDRIREYRYHRRKAAHFRLSAVAADERGAGSAAELHRLVAESHDDDARGIVYGAIAGGLAGTGAALGLLWWLVEVTS